VCRVSSTMPSIESFAGGNGWKERQSNLDITFRLVVLCCVPPFLAVRDSSELSKPTDHVQASPTRCAHHAVPAGLHMALQSVLTSTPPLRVRFLVSRVSISEVLASRVLSEIGFPTADQFKLIPWDTNPLCTTHTNHAPRSMYKIALYTSKYPNHSVNQTLTSRPTPSRYSALKVTASGAIRMIPRNLEDQLGGLNSTEWGIVR
jgi:hypothetical protein